LRFHRNCLHAASRRAITIANNKLLYRYSGTFNPVPLIVPIWYEPECFERSGKPYLVPSVELIHEINCFSQFPRGELARSGALALTPPRDAFSARGRKFLVMKFKSKECKKEKNFARTSRGNPSQGALRRQGWKGGNSTRTCHGDLPTTLGRPEKLFPVGPKNLAYARHADFTGGAAPSRQAGLRIHGVSFATSFVNTRHPPCAARRSCK